MKMDVEFSEWLALREIIDSGLIPKARKPTGITGVEPGAGPASLNPGGHGLSKESVSH